jgi:hypothetical protein
MAAVPTNADALPLLPFGNACTHFIDDAGHFMPWNAGILKSGPTALYRDHITVANTAGLHLDAHVSRTRVRNLALDDLEVCSGLRNLRDFHWCYCESCGCHDASRKVAFSQMF